MSFPLSYHKMIMHTVAEKRLELYTFEYLDRKTDKLIVKYDMSKLCFLST